MSNDCDDGGCGDLATQRIRYFTGRHMTARDFADEQQYHRTHRLLHNRVLHGWGVVCGLHVSQHPAEKCRNDYVKVSCGLALDCCGREIAVPKDVVPPPLPWSERPADGHVWYALLCLEYCEAEIECVPVLYSEQNCDPQRRENSRIDERYRFAWHWVRESDLPSFQWKTPKGGCPGVDENHPCPDDDCAGDEGTKHCCLDPQCPPHHCVPLALLEQPQGPIDDADIRMKGRPSLEPPSHSLTHICSINWEHGGIVRREDLDTTLRQLRVTFDRRVKPASSEPCGPDGVNACTFIVQYGGGSEDLDFVPYYKPPHLEHGCVAVYTIDRRSHDYRNETHYAYLENQIVFITLKCDFILDCHDVAVDGNHIGGVLPSGDGIRGGTFESWFRVVSNDEWTRIQNETEQKP